MYEALLDWIKLNIAVPSGNKVCSLVSRFGSASAVYSAGRRALLESRCVDESTVDLILGADTERAESILEVCRYNNWQIISPQSEHYPKEFLRLRDFPLLLYCDGDVSLLGKYPKIAVVGTRNPSDFGLVATYELACCLSSLDIVTVSGGALGIDTAAHEGALTDNGGTVSVMGCGLGAKYLEEKSFMRKRIAANGLIISEYPPFQMPTVYTFPRRNRLIAALGQGTVVAQSGVKGGSLITADYTVKYGKALCCFDKGVVNSPGCNNLLNRGAYSFSTPGELLDKLGIEVKEVRDRNRDYFNYDLHNNGIKGVHIIKTSSMTPDTFALYNGITPEEARRVMGNRLKAPRQYTLPPREAKQEIIPQKPRDEKAPKTGDKPQAAVKQKENVKPKREETPKNEKPTDLSFLKFVSQNAKTVYEKLSSAPMLMDEIQYATSLPSGLVLAAVTELELCDAVTVHTGNRVSKR